jgi:hypothetical protein
MNGRNLPPPVEAMLERRHGFLDAEPHNLKVEGGKNKIEDICGLILRSV